MKLKRLFLSLLAASSTLSAAQGTCSEFTYKSEPCCCSQPLLEVKAGYFFFSDSTMRKIYDRDGWDIQLCGSYPLWSLTNRWTLHAYGAVEYFRRSGKSLNGEQETSIWSIPVNIGLKPVYAINANLQYYFAVGPRYFYIHQHNDSPYIYRSQSRNGLGFFANTGFYYALCDCLRIDIFGEYSYAKVHFRSEDPTVYTRSMQVGGFTFGAGLGYSF